jgi:hypothetical protein
MNEKSNRAEESRRTAVELAISAIAAYKQSVFSYDFDAQLVRAADVIAEYIVNGQIPAQDS